MTFEFRAAKRENVPLLIGLAGASGSGKTYSALKLAAGLAGGKPFALIDTEAGRALHYADQFTFAHGDLQPPFTPERYAEAIQAADAAGYPVIVVDSFSHEYAGDGGLLDWHETELTRMAGEDWKKREAFTFAAWVKPKSAHKRLVQQLLQVRAHLVLCLRAEEKIEIVKNRQTGKTEVVPKRTLSGHVGWIPTCEKTLPYELTVSLVLTPDAPGVPKPIKLQEQHRPMIPLDQPISEDTGAALAKWATGVGSSSTPPPPPPPAVQLAVQLAVPAEAYDLGDRLLGLAERAGARDAAKAAIEKNRLAHANDPAQHIAWLTEQVRKAEAKAASEVTA